MYKLRKTVSSRIDGWCWVGMSDSIHAIDHRAAIAQREVRLLQMHTVALQLACSHNNLQLGACTDLPSLMATMHQSMSEARTMMRLLQMPISATVTF